MPGTADHPITTEPAPSRVRVTFAGRVVADSKKALVLKEASYRPVIYVPREDADFSLLKRTDNKTHCPYKGDASYYSIEADGRSSTNAIWSYEHPIPDMAAITGYLAFYPDRVDAIEQLPA
jgi:uncharacterized protein (DUF427 family)